MGPEYRLDLATSNGSLANLLAAEGKNPEAEAAYRRTIALQEKLAQATSAVKWVEHDNLHVTLLFLGEVDDREVHRGVSGELSGYLPG